MSSNTARIPIWKTNQEYEGKISIVYHLPSSSFYLAKISHTSDNTNEPPNFSYWQEMIESSAVSNSNKINASSNTGNGGNSGNGGGSNKTSGLTTSTYGVNKNTTIETPSLMDSIQGLFGIKNVETTTATNGTNGTNGTETGANNLINMVILVIFGLVIFYLMYLFMNSFFTPVNPEITAGPVQRAERAIETLVSETEVGKKILSKISSQGYTKDQYMKGIKDKVIKASNMTGGLTELIFKNNLDAILTNIDFTNPITETSLKSIKVSIDDALRTAKENAISRVTNSISEAVATYSGFDLQVPRSGGFGGGFGGGFSGGIGNWGGQF